MIGVFLDEMEEKLKILRKMKSKSIEDFVPLMQMESTELLTDVNGREELIYYFSERLNVSSKSALKSTKHCLTIMSCPIDSSWCSCRTYDRT